MPESRPLRRCLYAVALLGAAAAVGEAVAYKQGFGQPALVVPHPAVGSLWAPLQDARPGGTHFATNAYGMRSRTAPPRRADPRELRVLVLGDEVVCGDDRVANARLATSLLEDRLARDLGRPVWVGNAAAESWGPGNQLAYLREYGPFDADLVVWVVGSGDAADAAGPGPPEAAGPRPARRPPSALLDFVLRTYDRYSAKPAAPGPGPAAARPGPRALSDARELVRLVSGSVGRLAVVGHYRRSELEGASVPAGLAAVEALVHETPGATVADDRSALSEAVRSEAAGRGGAVYEDDVRLTAEGHKALAAVLHEVVLRRMPSEADRRAPGPAPGRSREARDADPR